MEKRIIIFQERKVYMVAKIACPYCNSANTTSVIYLDNNNFIKNNDEDDLLKKIKNY